MLLKLKTQVNSQNVQNTKFSMFSKFYDIPKTLKMLKIQTMSKTSLNFKMCRMTQNDTIISFLVNHETHI